MVTRLLPWELTARSGAGAEAQAAARCRLPVCPFWAPLFAGAVGKAKLEEGREQMRPPSGNQSRAS